MTVDVPELGPAHGLEERNAAARSLPYYPRTSWRELQVSLRGGRGGTADDPLLSPMGNGRLEQGRRRL